jgi:hypothetical protein
MISRWRGYFTPVSKQVPTCYDITSEVFAEIAGQPPTRDMIPSDSGSPEMDSRLHIDADHLILRLTRGVRYQTLMLAGNRRDRRSGRYIRLVAYPWPAEPFQTKPRGAAGDMPCHAMQRRECLCEIKSNLIARRRLIVHVTFTARKRLRVLEGV